MTRLLLRVWLALSLMALWGCVGGGGGGGGEGGEGGGDDAAVDAGGDAAPVCQPDCTERVCGPDGCGGECGACPEGQACAGGQCDEVPASCGDGTCGDGETCALCPTDCGDCCGDGVCDAEQRENCAACATDCACPAGQRCDEAAMACVAECTPDCNGRECGPDGCGGECGQCAEGVCDADGRCGAPPDSCGDGACDDGEDCANCADDCACADDQRCDRGACVADCPDDCGPAWQSTCTADGFGYRLCAPDPARPGCTAASRRILCGDGRDCVAGDGGDRCVGRCLRPEVLVLVDRSSSMEGERWQFTRSALVDLAVNRADFARLGLRVFPGEADACTAGPLEAPAFDATAAFGAMPAPAQVAQTPIAAALEGADDAFGDPDEGESVILLTDGDETCAGEFDAVEVAAALRRQGVRTFVIGIGREANGDLLTAIAEAGGTAEVGQPAYAAVNDGPALRAALDDILDGLETGRIEACNGRDDDCDGLADEALDPPLADRQAGACAGAVRVCDDEWVEPDYTAVDGYELIELSCDGIDNDCDGITDEGIVAPPAELTDGVCTDAVQVCDGGWVEPDYAAIDGYEAPESSCDDRDNDCDGEVDEDLVAPAAEVQAGICAGARQECDGEWVEPDYGALPGHEVPELSCDGRDNDCDGRVDEALVAPAARQQDGVCAGAVQVCSGRWREPDYAATIADYESPEVTCEGLDNDCDGRIDEDTECPTICGRDDVGPPCNRCPEGTVVPPGWVCAPAGQFVIGSPGDEPGRSGDEPQRALEISRPFLIQQTEVTRDQWTALFALDPSRRAQCDPDDPESASECPVDSLNWYEAAAFANALTAADRAALTPCYTLDDCRGAVGDGMECDPAVGFDPTCTGYRLPTEAEWEYATRAGTRTRFWSGAADADLARVGWYEANSGDHAHPVGRRPANLWGLYDVHGNVREWCHDWYGDYLAGDPVDRYGPAAGNFRIARGGGFDDSPAFARSADRVRWVPDTTSPRLGFRLARPVTGLQCGDGVCDADDGERCDTCRADCGACCGDGVCDRAVGETCATCVADCGCEGDLVCHLDQCLDCVPDCDGRACGTDDCGGSCGVCDAGEVCEAGACEQTGLELIVDEVTPLDPGDRRLEIVALVPPDLRDGAVEDAHGRLVARFGPTGQAGREVAFVSWEVLNAVEPIDGGRRTRRALYAVYSDGAETVRQPFTARLRCPAGVSCLGVCQARAEPCERAVCDGGCAGDQSCIDRQCVDRVGGVALAGLRPRETGLRPGEVVPRNTKGTALEVRLDQPAPPGGTVVRLESLDPAIRVPAEVQVPAGADSASVIVDVLATTHGAGLIARLGGHASYAEVRTLPAITVDPPLVINEIDYDQPGVDTLEFVELHNPTAAVQSPANLALLLVNGDDDGDPYAAIALDALPPIPPGGYAVIADDDVVADGPRLPLGGTDLQGGDSDGVLLVDTLTGQVLDSLGYDGFLLGTTEGEALEFDLRGDRQEAFSRCDDGVDTNDNRSDFARVIPTPGRANACP